MTEHGIAQQNNCRFVNSNIFLVKKFTSHAGGDWFSFYQRLFGVIKEEINEYKPCQQYIYLSSSFHKALLKLEIYKILHTISVENDRNYKRSYNCQVTNNFIVFTKPINPQKDE